MVLGKEFIPFLVMTHKTLNSLRHIPYSSMSHDDGEDRLGYISCHFLGESSVGPVVSELQTVQYTELFIYNANLLKWTNDLLK